MRFLYSIIFNVVLLSFCSMNEPLFAGFKKLKQAYSNCGSIEKKWILSLKKELKGITLNSTQDDIFDAIKISLPCAGCVSCISKINEAIHKFFDNLQTDELLSDLKPIQELIKDSILESCQAHQRKKRLLCQKKNKYHNLKKQIQDDYDDYLMHELTDR